MTLMNPAAPPQPPLTVAKLRHDAEQFAYLQRLGVLGADYGAIVQRYRQLADQMAARHISKRERPTADELAGIGGIYNRIIHLRPTPAMVQIYSDSWQGADVEQAYRSNPPGIVV